MTNNIFYLDPKGAPFTHNFGDWGPRWPEGQFKCLQRQGYEGRNVKTITYNFASSSTTSTVTWEE